MPGLLMLNRKPILLAAGTNWAASWSCLPGSAVISYGINIWESFRRTTTYIDKILKGAKPSELPVELPSSVEMIINLKSAKALGLTVAPTMLGHADEVIE
jgi:putative ABC transport system substrate-binding protein